MGWGDQVPLNGSGADSPHDTAVAGCSATAPYLFVLVAEQAIPERHATRKSFVLLCNDLPVYPSSVFIAHFAFNPCMTRERTSALPVPDVSIPRPRVVDR